MLLTLTLLIDLANEENPLGVILCTASNTQWDFLAFVIKMVARKQLVCGDYLVIDNATVHHGAASWDALQHLLKIMGVELIFLLKYSPEFNPCELVFAMMKNWLCWHHSLTNPLWVEILVSLACISFNKAYYWKCTQADKIK